ncbi:hypothetical protein L9F63_002214, partial [Diploptera punctata]
DLAARNCLVTPDLIVKIGDYGTSIETFKEDYYCAGEVALPIRWCAPETLYCTETTIETKEVTVSANVWSFGVVLWEICEFGKLPYSELTDDEVIVKVLGEGTHRLGLPSLPCPHRQNLYLLMKLCWRSMPDRPLLVQVHSMLNHLHTSRERYSQDGDSLSLKTDEDFERRWEMFKPNTIPKTDNHVKSSENTPNIQSPVHSVVDSPAKVCTPERTHSHQEIDDGAFHTKPLALQPAVFESIVSSRDSGNLTVDGSSITPLTTSPQPSLASSSGGEFFIPTLQLRHKSPSLQNLRGSIDDLSEVTNITTWQKTGDADDVEHTSEILEEKEGEAVLLDEGISEKETEGIILEPDFDSWLKGVETTNEEDAKFVRKISEAIRDLDNALALEKTSSSSSSEASSKSVSHQSPAKDTTILPSEQNVVLDFRLGRADSGVSSDDKEMIFQPDSLQDDSFMENAKNRGTDSGTDTEDETWRRRIERGEFSEKVKEKSKSVADLMVLTHIECSSGSDSDPPSLTWSFERSPNTRGSFTTRVRPGSFNKQVPAAFSSESNIHGAVLGEEFKDTLKKLHEAQRENSKITKPELFQKLDSDKNTSNYNRENFLANDASEELTKKIGEEIKTKVEDVMCLDSERNVPVLENNNEVRSSVLENSELGIRIDANTDFLQSSSSQVPEKNHASSVLSSSSENSSVLVDVCSGVSELLDDNVPQIHVIDSSLHSVVEVDKPSDSSDASAISLLEIDNDSIQEIKEDSLFGSSSSLPLFTSTPYHPKTNVDTVNCINYASHILEYSDTQLTSSSVSSLSPSRPYSSETSNEPADTSYSVNTTASNLPSDSFQFSPSYKNPETEKCERDIEVSPPEYPVTSNSSSQINEDIVFTNPETEKCASDNEEIDENNVHKNSSLNFVPSVVLGPCEDYTLDYFKGLKTTSGDDYDSRHSEVTSPCLERKTYIDEKPSNSQQNPLFFDYCIDSWEKHISSAFREHEEKVASFDNISFKSGTDSLTDEDQMSNMNIISRDKSKHRVNKGLFKEDKILPVLGEGIKLNSSSDCDIVQEDSQNLFHHDSSNVFEDVFSLLEDSQCDKNNSIDMKYQEHDIISTSARENTREINNVFDFNNEEIPFQSINNSSENVFLQTATSKDVLTIDNLPVIQSKITSSGLCIPSLNFIAATPVPSGRNTPEIYGEERNFVANTNASVANDNTGYDHYVEDIAEHNPDKMHENTTEELASVNANSKIVSEISTIENLEAYPDVVLNDIKINLQENSSETNVNSSDNTSQKTNESEQYTTIQPLMATSAKVKSLIDDLKEVQFSSVAEENANNDDTMFIESSNNINEAGVIVISEKTEKPDISIPSPTNNKLDDAILKSDTILSDNIDKTSEKTETTDSIIKMHNNESGKSLEENDNFTDIVDMMDLPKEITKTDNVTPMKDVCLRDASDEVDITMVVTKNNCSSDDPSKDIQCFVDINEITHNSEDIEKTDFAFNQLINIPLPETSVGTSMTESSKNIDGQDDIYRTMDPLDNAEQNSISSGKITKTDIPLYESAKNNYLTNAAEDAKSADMNVVSSCDENLLNLQDISEKTDLTVEKSMDFVPLPPKSELLGTKVVNLQDKPEDVNSVTICEDLNIAHTHLLDNISRNNENLLDFTENVEEPVSSLFQKSEDNLLDKAIEEVEIVNDISSTTKDEVLIEFLQENVPLSTDLTGTFSQQLKTGPIVISHEEIKLPSAEKEQHLFSFQNSKLITQDFLDNERNEVESTTNDLSLEKIKPFSLKDQDKIENSHTINELSSDTNLFDENNFKEREVLIEIIDDGIIMNGVLKSNNEAAFNLGIAKQHPSTDSICETDSLDIKHAQLINFAEESSGLKEAVCNQSQELFEDVSQNKPLPSPNVLSYEHFPVETLDTKLAQSDIFSEKESNRVNAVIDSWKNNQFDDNSRKLMEDFLLGERLASGLTASGLEIKESLGENFETTGEAEDDNEDFGLDAVKHSTPDDERSSDSGFRDKGSLSESCEDACDEKYNLEDIEAELEETFNKGGFTYVDKHDDNEGDHHEDIQRKSSTRSSDDSAINYVEKIEQDEKKLSAGSSCDSADNRETLEDCTVLEHAKELQKDVQYFKETTLLEEDIDEEKLKEMLGIVDGTKASAAFLKMENDMISHYMSPEFFHQDDSTSQMFECSKPDSLNLSDDSIESVLLVQTPEDDNVKPFVKSSCTVAPCETGDLLNLDFSPQEQTILSEVDQLKENITPLITEKYSQDGHILVENNLGEEFTDKSEDNFEITTEAIGLEVSHAGEDISESGVESESESRDFQRESALTPTSGWYLHPPPKSGSCDSGVNYSEEDERSNGNVEEFPSPTNSGTCSNNSENSYVSFSLDEEFVNAIRNELREKLPISSQQSLEEDSEDDEILDPDDDLTNDDRTDIMIHYNTYPVPLSPILEERESVSSVTTTISDHYSPFASSNQRDVTKSGSDSEPMSPVFILEDSKAKYEVDAKKFEQEIREALENCSFSSSEDSGSSCDKNRKAASVFFEDLDQQLTDNSQNTSVDAAVNVTNAVVIQGTNQHSEDDDLLVVNTETNEATLLESPKPKAHLAFVNSRKRIQEDLNATPDFISDDEIAVGVNSDTFIVEKETFDSECKSINRKETSSDDEVYTPDSISPEHATASSLHSPDTENLSDFFLTPSEKSPTTSDCPNTPQVPQNSTVYNPYFLHTLVQNQDNPTYDEVQEIHLVANNEAEEIISELENSGILLNNNISNEKEVISALLLPDKNISLQESPSSRESPANDNSDLMSVEESSESSESVRKDFEENGELD